MRAMHPGACVGLSLCNRLGAESSRPRSVGRVGLATSGPDVFFTMISIAQFLEDTSGCAFLKGLERGHLERLASLAKEYHSKAGQVIFEEGARHGRFYLLCEGEVALEMGQRTLAKLKAGEALGWSSLAGSSGAHFRARALTPLYALAFDGAQLAAACEADPAFGYFIMKALLGVVTERLDAARMQLGAGHDE